MADAPAGQPGPPMTPSAVQRALAVAIDLLEGGQEEAALAEIDRVLQSDAGNRLAQSLKRQIREDPVALLGSTAFSYRVQPGESLSLIALRALNDRFLFYALARYNGIRVPRQLAGGQTIRVPGRGMPPGPALSAQTAPAPAPSPQASPAAAPAPPVTQPVPAAAPLPDPGRAERERRETMRRHEREARTAAARQDLDGAIRSWDRVLEIDPGNRAAMVERQRAVDLNERAKRLPAAR